MRRLLQDKKAITLIALVITIIVLLILAGVTVATLTGENGLLSKAQLAKERNAEAQSKEEEQLKDFEEQIETLGRAGSTSSNYSTDEKSIGTWIDGKTLYRRVWNVHLDSISTTPTYIETEVKGKDVNVKRLQTYLCFSDGKVWNISNYTGYDWSEYNDSGYRVRAEDTFSNVDVIGILEYTKP